MQKINLDDTICSIATPLGEGSISVIRLSGNQSFNLIEKIFFKDKNKLKRINIAEENSHTLHFGYIFKNDELLDEVLISVFKSPNSYTGEDVIEISSHGGVYNTQRILDTIIDNGIRHAEPGEFTKRAFLNGKLDLTQAEAVSDLISAKTNAAHSSSIKQLEGSLSKLVQKIRTDIINITSLVELELDFAEEDLEFVKKSELKEKVAVIIQRLKNIITTYIQGKIVREGVNLVLAGKPNSGKSSLFNYLLKYNRAIVSNIAGTTRDYIQENLIIGGVLFNLVDTAGLRFSEDIIEEEGIKRSYEKIQEADLVLYLVDVSEGEEFLKKEREYFGKNFNWNNSLFVLTKVDLIDNGILNPIKDDEISISIFDNASIENMKMQMLRKVNAISSNLKADEIILTNLRHKICLENVVNSLESAINSIDQRMTGEFISVDLRNALNYLGEITGEVTNDDILNNIFSKFCIGK